ncbi:uncharacterized protein LOC115414923 isoform X2 [Sphaeramia orbicularis]|uniref:uncharacterized protein LOC115414923 isoform X2 n=1 Tax=Sphaeramia orbicularis TaxID=375764 RepID=UPI00117CEAFD|nr:uncharacterized protein LOC115414923 isoform X2 [Sphaeramia orbicularis]
MSTAVESGEIIILSDDEEPENEASVFIVEVEDEKKNDSLLSTSALDEDLVVTFSRQADVLPHARYDCPVHPFTATDYEMNAPVEGNQLICEQCFCYICDKPASSCELWCYSGMCHCNSHKKSVFWTNLRNCSLLGGLKAFNFTLSEIVPCLRQAENMLQCFRAELSAKFSSFLNGKTAKEYGLNQEGRVHDYTPVYQFVSSFLNQADKQEARAAAVMRLGAAEDFMRHFPVPGDMIFLSPMGNTAEAKRVLLQRVISSVQRQMVMIFTPQFNQKLQDFYKRISFPPEMKNMKNSLSVRPWDDVLLVSVLKGQNVSGVRKDKGKKDVLNEQMSVVLLRAEFLQQQRRYRELYRYLRVVQTDDANLFQQLQDLIPFFMCMDGDLTSALHGLLLGHISRFTPDLFLLYLRIFETASAPIQMVSQPAQLCSPQAVWKSIKGAVPLKRADLVRFALRVQRCNAAVFTDSQCWTHLLTVVNSPCGSSSGLPEPTPQYLHESKGFVNSILLDQSAANIQIPRYFQEVYPDQALLLLVTGALYLRILNAALIPVLPVLNTFKNNGWALRWLWESLSSTSDRFNSFLQEITQEVENTTGRGLAVDLHTGSITTCF